MANGTNSILRRTLDRFALRPALSNSTSPGQSGNLFTQVINRYAGAPNRHWLQPRLGTLSAFTRSLLGKQIVQRYLADSSKASLQPMAFRRPRPKIVGSKIARTPVEYSEPQYGPDYAQNLAPAFQVGDSDAPAEVLSAEIYGNAANSNDFFEPDYFEDYAQPAPEPSGLTGRLADFAPATSQILQKQPAPLFDTSESITAAQMQPWQATPLARVIARAEIENEAIGSPSAYSYNPQMRLTLPPQIQSQAERGQPGETVYARSHLSRETASFNADMPDLSQFSETSAQSFSPILVQPPEHSRFSPALQRAVERSGFEAAQAQPATLAVNRPFSIPNTPPALIWRKIGQPYQIQSQVERGQSTETRAEAEAEINRSGSRVKNYQSLSLEGDPVSATEPGYASTVAPNWATAPTSSAIANFEPGKAVRDFSIRRLTASEGWGEQLAALRLPDHFGPNQGQGLFSNSLNRVLDSTGQFVASSKNYAPGEIVYARPNLSRETSQPDVRVSGLNEPGRGSQITPASAQSFNPIERNISSPALQRAVERSGFEAAQAQPDILAVNHPFSSPEMSYTPPALIWRKIGQYVPDTTVASEVTEPSLLSVEAGGYVPGATLAHRHLSPSMPGYGGGQALSRENEVSLPASFVPGPTMALRLPSQQFSSGQRTNLDSSLKLPALQFNPAVNPWPTNRAEQTQATINVLRYPVPTLARRTETGITSASQFLPPLAHERATTQSPDPTFAVADFATQASGSLVKSGAYTESEDGAAEVAPFTSSSSSSNKALSFEASNLPLGMLHPQTWIQRKAADGESAPASPIGAFSGPGGGLQLGAGRPLESSVQSRMSQSFGLNFEHVRVHTDDHAASQVARMGAEAFTTGPNIVFGPGRYQPETPAGQALIGHELTHVIQQASLPSLGGGRIAEVSAQGQALEREAIHNEGLILRHLSNTPSVGQALQPAIAAVNSFAQSQSAPSLVERSLASFEPSHLRIENGGRNENGSFNGVVERVVNPSSNSVSSGSTVQRVNGQEGSNHHDGADHHEGSDKEKGPDMEELAKKVLQMLKQELIIERERQGWNNSRYF